MKIEGLDSMMYENDNYKDSLPEHIKFAVINERQLMSFIINNLNYRLTIKPNSKWLDVENCLCYFDVEFEKEKAK